MNSSPRLIRYISYMDNRSSVFERVSSAKVDTYDMATILRAARISEALAAFAGATVPLTIISFVLFKYYWNYIGVSPLAFVVFFLVAPFSCGISGIAARLIIRRRQSASVKTALYLMQKVREAAQVSDADEIPVVQFQPIDEPNRRDPVMIQQAAQIPEMDYAVLHG